MSRDVFLNDTTLRDGEQAPGVAFTTAEKLELAESLVAAGVPEIEIGTPIMGSDEIETIRAAVERRLPVRLTAWCRMKARDLDAAIESGIGAVNLSLPASDIQLAAKLGLDQAGALQVIEDMVRRAAASGFFVAVGCEDASRADRDLLARVIETAARAGASRVRLADTVGILDPFSTFELVAQLMAKSEASRRQTATIKPVVGADVFTHESGTHVAGLLKDSRAYQGLDPALVGRCRRIVIGKHSGATSIARVLSESGRDLDPDLAAAIVARVRRKAAEVKSRDSNSTGRDLRWNVQRGTLRGCRRFRPAGRRTRRHHSVRQGRMR
ncbi:homocitrate synthase/isopropylmalate synthase family protein [Mesorhizobium hawassense]|uniref:homocitrate synthase/isopropylmalate synthase family protein n=1 Tax=Mesorhizobium hawassense TaxID=1209954 RepID=UPI001FE18B26|nr:hypothetical protein [Mesorhizobium hawassense]